MIDKIKSIKYVQLLKRDKKKINSLIHRYITTNSIFVHIPKTGGMSIVAAVYGDAEGGGHPNIRIYKKLFGNSFETMFKFTVVRNPYDRLRSAYRFMKSGGLHMGDKLWAEKNLGDFESFEEFVLKWVNAKNVGKAIHFKPQYLFVTDNNDRLLVDLVLRNESLYEDFERLKQHVDTVGELQQINRSQRSISDEYTQEMREIVKAVYSKDFELFGYEQ